MAHSITIPFFAFKLHLSEDNSLKIPLLDAQALRINEPMHLLAGRYAEKLQKKVLNEGDFHRVMEEYVGDHYLKESVKVPFTKSKDGISYPNFELEFELYYVQKEKGFWGTVPVIGVDGFGHSLERLKIHLQEAIQLDFTRNKRLQWVGAIITTIWQETIELKKEDILLRFPSLKELENIQEHSQEQWLPKIAKIIKIDKRVVYGRSAELEQVAKALKGKFTRNVLLVGASGVGKTALIWELIRQKNERKIEGDFWETTASVLIKELTKETGWQDNLSKVCKEIARCGAVLYISSFMELFEVGKYDGNSVSIADYLRPYITRGEVTVVSECSDEELARIELNSPNYLAAFQVIRLEEPKTDLEEIIIKKVQDLAAKRAITISEEAIQETLRLNRRFTPYSGLPGKPIRFLESILINQKNNPQQHIDRSTIIRYFSEETGMPLFMVDPSIPMNIETTRNTFNTSVFGQAPAVDSIVNLLSSVKTALTRIGKPIASFLFVGPTGVGKTELAKVLAQFMFGSRDKMIRFDMSEYADPYSVSRLTGSNYLSDGLLTSAVRQAPFCVLLFDEIEKAHSNFFDLLLQVLSEGRLTDSRGKLVNFCSTIIIMTSNIGAANLQGNRISLNKKLDTDTVTTHFISAVQRFFRPELYNRIDEVIPFSPLSSETIRFVVEREISLFKQLEGIQYRRVTLTLAAEVYDYLAEKGYNPQYGARQLQRAVREHLIIPLSQQLNLYDSEDQLNVSIAIQESALAIEIEVDPLGMDLMLEELEKGTLTDIASGARRTLAQLEESNTFISLLNTLQEMERVKRKKEKIFWKNQKKAAQYSHYLRLKEGLYTLKGQIKKLEQELSLAYMGLSTFTTALEVQLKQWQADFFAYQIDLCSHIFPVYNTSYLSIYGIPITQQLDIYTKLLNKKDYTVAIKTIWFRDALYNETIPTRGAESEEIQELVKGRYIKKAYFEIGYDAPANKKFKPDQKGDLLVGVQLKIEGDSVHLLLKEESGMHLWKVDTKKPNKLVVAVATEEIATPDGIHRQDFYSKLPPRRTYEIEQFVDKSLKKSFEVVKEDYLTPLMAYLEKIFKKNLEGELY